MIDKLLVGYLDRWCGHMMLRCDDFRFNTIKNQTSRFLYSIVLPQVDAVCIRGCLFWLLSVVEVFFTPDPKLINCNCPPPTTYHQLNKQMLTFTSVVTAVPSHYTIISSFFSIQPLIQTLTLLARSFLENVEICIRIRKTSTHTRTSIFELFSAVRVE